MKKPISSWTKTLRALGFNVVRRRAKTSHRGRDKTNQPISYGTLEPRQLLAGDSGLIHIVDRGEDASFQYTLDGNSVDQFSIDNVNNARGAATSPDGSSLFVLNANKRITVFDTATNTQLGTWRAKGVSSVEGIATDGTDIWIVDKARDRVSRFRQAANRTTGNAYPSDSFRLARHNRAPSGITTDGDRLWVSDKSSDRVFVYSENGDALGSWSLDSSNRHPTGVAIDPAGGEGLWVLDAKDDQVYFYEQGRRFQWGHHSASSEFSLASDNRKGEGIAISPDTAVNPPSTPVVNTITDDTGFSNFDELTNDTTLLVSGNADPGNSVMVTEANLGELGSSTVDENGNWTVDASAFALTDGTYLFSAIAFNGIEFSDSSPPFAVEIDTHAPVNLAVLRVNRDTGFDDSDGITSDNTLFVIGVTEPDVLVSLSEATLGELGSVSSTNDGDWIIDLASMALADGVYVFAATATDRAGNETLPSAPLAIVVDTASPDAPIIDAISDDTGVDSMDGITNSPVQTLSGTAEPEARITLTDSSAGIVAVTFADAVGNWSIEAMLAESAYDITASAVDRAGNESTPSNVLSLVIDQTTPIVPAITGFETDSGTTGDGITNDETLIFHGTAESGSFVKLVESTLGDLGTVIADANGIWTNDLSEVVLVNGSYQFSAISEDLAGNISGPSSAVDVMVDTLAPGVPLIMRVDDDSGTDASDGVTNDNTLILTGLAPAHKMVNFFDVALGQIGSTVADDNGEWVLDLTGTELADGNYSLTASSEDPAGNTSDSSPEFAVVIDTVSPPVPTLDLDPNFDSPPVGDHTTDASVVKLTGQTEPGAFVSLIQSPGPDESIFETVADANGDFDFDPISLIAGPNHFTVLATDLAGNAASFGQTIVNTVSDPDAPYVEVALDNDTGQSSTDGITTDPTVYVYIEDASPVTAEFILYSDVLETEYAVDITAELNDFGGFAYAELDVPFYESIIGGSLPYGRYTYSVHAIDLFGNAGFDGEYEFTYVPDDNADMTPPQVNVELFNDTGQSNSDGITTDASLSGVVVDESPVMLTLAIADEDDLESGITHEGDITDLLIQDGTFFVSQARLEMILGKSLGPRMYFVSVEATDQLNVGGDSIGFTYAVLPSPPEILSVTNDSGFDHSDAITRDKTLTIIGSADPSTEVELFASSIGSLGLVPTDSNGDWRISVPSPGLADGIYELTAYSIASGQQSAASNVFNVTIDTEAPLRATFGLDAASDSGTIGDSYTTTPTVTLVGTTLANAEVQLVQTGQSVVAGVDGTFSFNEVQLTPGLHDYHVVTIDAAGNQKFSVTSIEYDQPITIAETGFVTEATRMVPLGPLAGRQTITFNVDADLGERSGGLEDALMVYLVDPDDQSETLLDRGQRGTALFSLIGNRSEYLPGLVRFDGSKVEIDVSSVEGFSEGLLLFQLINNDVDTTASVSITHIGVKENLEALPSPVFGLPPTIVPGSAIDVAGLTTSPDLVLVHENLRYDSNTNTYVADIRIRNDGADLGRTIAATFGGLAADTTMLKASGFDGIGNPYISFRTSIPTYGLLAGQTSDPVRVEFVAPSVSPFGVEPILSDGGANSAPVLDAIGTLDVMPGDVVRLALSATDSDGEGFYYAISSAVELPNVRLAANGELIIAPTPDQLGSYSFNVVATDGLLSSSQPVILNVVADPVSTTRISGVVMDTNSIPLAGIPVELAGTQVLTAADGTFELEFAGALPGDTLKVHGEAFAGSEVYPFIAEKLPLLYGHEAYDGVNNFIERPIYLPALDVANGVTIDPAVDVTVTTSAIPGASVFVAAGSLDTQAGGNFTGKLSITEVPADFTPAALPSDLFPDLVVTIQPGEMVFTTPAPLNLPNLAGYFPGTQMTLWSINPNTGLFDDVGLGVVSADGNTVETVSGGINNSSWHFFAPAGPVINQPNPRNQDKTCVDCEETDAPNDDHAPVESSEPNEGDIPLDTAAIQNLAETLLNPYIYRPAPTGGSSSNGGRTGGLDGGWGTGGNVLLDGPADFGPYGSYDFGGSGASVNLAGLGSGNVTPSNQPVLSGNQRNANDTRVALHSGAVYKSHQLAPYQSLGSWHGLTLNYDSERADARPIVSTSFSNIQSNLPDPTLATKLSLTRGSLTMEVPGFIGNQSGLTGGEHFFGFPSGATTLDVAIQADLRNMPTGVYEYESTNRIAGNASGAFTGTASVSTDRLVHVNTRNSPFGAGWGLSGLLEVVANPDGSALIIDGDGGEYLFEAPPEIGEAYGSPAGDFSTLIQLADGRFQRTHVDQTVELYSLSNKLVSVTDRNGNVTQFQYNASDDLELIVDPVGLTTVFRYTSGMVTEIEDPAGRITVLNYQDGNFVSVQDPDTTVREFSYDSFHRLTGEVDKLGHIEAIDYGFSGRIESITRKDGSSVKYSPVQTQGLSRPDQTNNLSSDVTASSFGNLAVARKADGNGNVTRVGLDSQGQHLEAVDAEGNLPEVARNTDNLVERMVDGRGNLTIINYDERGNVVSISDPISRGAMMEPLFSNPAYAVAPYANEFVTADLNGDGFVDVVTESGTLGDNVTVMLGNGGGGFQPGVAYSVLDAVSLTVADVNNDGNTDVVTTNLGDQVSILLGRGDGTLLDAVFFATGIGPTKVQAADFNRDGFVDLVTTDSGGNTVSVLRGDGTGDFGSFTGYPVAVGPSSLAIGDVNHDQILDLVVGNNQVTDGLAILIGNGDGSFASANSITTIAGTEFVVLSDVTGDGNLDIVTGDSDLLILPGNGDGSFLDAEVIATGSSASEFRTVRAISLDADSDGDLDIVFADTANPQMLVFQNDGNGNLTLTQTIASGGGELNAADVNFDGLIDIVFFGNGISSAIGNGDGTFVEPAGLSTNNVAVGDEPMSLVAGDFNNDGHEDILVTTRADGTITVMLGAGDGTLTALAPVATFGRIVAAATSDLDDDGILDLVTAHYDLDTVEVRYGDGNGGFAAPFSIGLPFEGPLDVRIGDFNNDSRLDIAATGHRGAAAPGFSILPGKGDRTFEAGDFQGATFSASTLDVGDINGDGNLDLVVGVKYLASGNAAQPFLGNGDFTFTSQGRIPFGMGGGFSTPPVQQLRLVDIDSDGDLDIIGVDESQNSLKVLKGLDNGAFEPVVDYPMNSVPRRLDVGDVNNDGLPDVVATNVDSDRVSVFFGLTDGTLGARQDFLIGDGVFDVQLVDLDEDGALDIVATNFNDDTVSIRINSTDIANRAAKVFQYDPIFSQLTRLIDEEGRELIYEVDPNNGNILSVTEVIGEFGGDDDLVTSYSYLANGLVDTVTDPLGRISNMDYNSVGLLEKSTFAVGTLDEAFVTYEYDAAGNQVAVIDELLHRTEYVYDPLNRVTQITEADPDGMGPLESPVTTNVYDGHGNLVRAIDALNHSTQFIYDAQHRLTEVIDASLNSIKHEYDSAGNLVATMDRLDRRTEYVYDQRNRWVETIDAVRGRTEKKYDADNNVIATIDENRIMTRYAFDARNRMVRSTNALGGKLRYEFDRVNNLTAVIDELRRRTELNYDELDRVIAVRLPDPDGGGPDASPITTHVYDDASNLVSTTDALGNTTTFGYDERDRLVQRRDADPDGVGPLLEPEWTYRYDNANRVMSATDPLGRITSFEFDDLNRLISETLPDPDGVGPDSSPVMTYSYDAVHNRTSVIDALGNASSIGYDELYRVVSTTAADPDGAGPLLSPVTTFVVDAEGQIERIVDPLGRTTSFTYDDLGRVVTETRPDPDGAGPDASPVMGYFYDAVGNEIAMSDALGNVTMTLYDDLYRVIGIVGADPDGVIGNESNPVTSFTYDAAHQLLSSVDPLQRTTRYQYDDLGRVIREIRPDPDGMGPDSSPEMAYVYDLMNNELSMTDALGNVTQYRYDNLYRLTAVIQADPDGAGPQANPTTNYAYDIASQRVTIADPLGRVSSLEYDNLGRVIREISPDPDGAGSLAAPDMSYVYDLMNNQLSVTDAVGNITQFQYDGLYRMTAVIEFDPDGAGPLASPVTQFVYDIASQLVTEVDPLNRTVLHQYDDLGRVVRITQPDPDGNGPLASPAVNYVYDSMNNQLSMTDPLGNVTAYEYDNLYRVVREIGEDLDDSGPLANPTTEYSYDLADNLLSLTDSSGNQTEFRYDDLDRMYEESIELGPGDFQTRQFAYDLQGNLIRKTDRNARVIELEYDDLYRLVEERWLDTAESVVNTIQFEFDEANQLLRAEDLTIGSRYDFTHDDLNRVTETLVSNGGPVVEFADAYDAESRRITRVATVGGMNDFRNVYTYDGLNRLSRMDQVGQSGGDAVADKRFDFGYNADDQLISISRFGDIVGGASDLVLQSSYGYDGIGRLDDLVHSNSAATIVDYDWAYDASSRIIRIVSSVDGASDFNYDRGDQLTGATHTSQTDEIYSYDEDGNRTNSGYSTGEYNRLASDGTFNYAYDAEGNRTNRTNIATGEVTEYGWDHRNRLVSITERINAGNAITLLVEHRFDVFNRWISKSVDADGEETGGSETTRYQYDGSQIVLAIDESGSVTNRYVWGPGVDQLLADEQAGDQVYWSANDHLGTIRDVVDSNGNVVNHLVYDSFGNVVSESNSAIEVLFGYTGRAFDESTGLQNNLNRWYEAATGNWISEDPISFLAGDANLYRYVGNNSLNSIDPVGLDVFLVARQFGADTPEARAVYADKFTAKVAPLAHAFLMFTDENGKVTNTFSWHPSEWADGDILAPWHDFKMQKTNLTDANKARPGRIWENDPADMTVGETTSETLFEEFLLTNNMETQTRMLQYIRGWMTVNGVGHEIGYHSEKDRFGNTTGLTFHVSAKDWAPTYNVYGQNCFWFATTVARENRVLSKSNLTKINNFNLGVGIKMSFADNQSFSQFAEVVFEPWEQTKGFNPISRHRSARAFYSLMTNNSIDGSKDYLPQDFGKYQRTAKWPKLYGN